MLVTLIANVAVLPESTVCVAGVIVIGAIAVGHVPVAMTIPVAVMVLFPVVNSGVNAVILAI